MTDAQPTPRRKAREVSAEVRRRMLPDGSRIAEVPTPCGAFVTVDEPDFDRMNALGFSPVWFLNGAKGFQYVRTQAPARFGIPSLVQVARVIAEPPLGCVVKYLNGNRLDLRRSNLVCEKGMSQAKAREQFFGELPRAAE